MIVKEKRQNYAVDNANANRDEENQLYEIYSRPEKSGGRRFRKLYTVTNINIYDENRRR